MTLRALLCVGVLLTGFAPAQTAAAPRGSHKTEMHGAGTSLPPLRMECKSAERAADLLGQYGCVFGTVGRILVWKHHTLALALCSGRGKCGFRALVLAPDRKKVGELAPLRGRLVAIVGNVGELHGHPVIRVRKRGQIQLAADPAPAEGDRFQKHRHGRLHYPGSNLPIPGLKRGRRW